MAISMLDSLLEPTANPGVGPARVVEDGRTYLGDRTKIGKGTPDQRLARLGLPDARINSLDDAENLFRDLATRQKDIRGPLVAVTAAVREAEMALLMGQPDAGLAMTLTLNAERQLCRFLGIPADYFSKCPENLRRDQINFWLTKLQATELNTKRLWRTQDDRVRGVVSTDYGREASHLRVVEQVKKGAENFALHAAWVSDKRMDLALYHPDMRLEIDGGRGEADKLYLGLHVSNGETGFTALEYTYFLFAAICCNFNIWGFEEVASGRAIHRSGRSLAEHLTEIPRTLHRMRDQKDDATRIVRAAQDEVLLDFSDEPDKIVAALKKVGVPGAVIEPAIAVAKSEFGGSVSRWALVQGLTRVSQTLGVDDRADVDKIAGKVLVGLALK